MATLPSARNLRRASMIPFRIFCILLLATLPLLIHAQVDRQFSYHANIDGNVAKM